MFGLKGAYFYFVAIQITFINPPHHGNGRSGTDYQESEN